jgi:hypothetical protein
MRFCTFLILLLSITGCAHRPARTLILSYSDFGPQSAAYETIGFEWYQWQPHGDSHPSSHDNVRVVVYDGMSLAQVQREYPVVERDRQDYRYLSLRRAVAYIDAHADELPSLLDTRKRLTSYFRYAK